MQRAGLCALNLEQKDERGFGPSERHREWPDNAILEPLEGGKSIARSGFWDLGSAQDVLKLNNQVAVQAKGDDQQDEPDDGEGADAAADRA